MKDRYLLTNEQRKYVGLEPIEEHWEAMDIKGTLYFFDGDIIRKKITSIGYGEDSFYYQEQELFVQTSDHRTMVVPKTAKGKPKKLNYTATTTFRPIGVYLSFNGRVLIGNYTTQKIFYSKKLSDANPTAQFEAWLHDWIEETTPRDMEELERFKQETRVHQAYQEGDIFAFKIDRRQFGFGKILIDLVKRRKTEEFKNGKNYGLAHLMGTALIIKVYHKISDTIEVDLDALEAGLSLPAQAMMDNQIYYGEHIIIGHREVTLHDFDEAPISMCKSIRATDPNIVYLQYGFIYREMTRTEFERYEDEPWYYKDYRDEGIGFSIMKDELKACIDAKSNAPYYQVHKEGKLNNPCNQRDKNRIFQIFGLRGDATYEENWKLHKATE